MRFWVGGTGNWDQSTTTHWATSSGGSGGASVPVAADDVIFDGNSGTGTVTVTANAPCRSIQSTGTTLTTFSHNASVTVTLGDSTAGSGNILFDFSGFTTYTIGSTSTSILSIASSSVTQQTMKSGGLTLPAITLSGFSATTPSLLLSDNFTCGAITQNGGIVNTNTKTITTPSWVHGGGNNRTITMTNSTINLTATSGTVWNIGGSPITLTATGSTIALTTASSSTRTFSGAGKTYGTLTYTVAGSTGQLTVSGANTFTQINFSDTSSARTISFPASTTTTISTAAGFNVFGTSGKLMSIISSTSGTAATLSITSGIVSRDYLSIKDSTAVSANGAYAGIHSTNVSGNTGWIFTAPPAVVPGNLSRGGIQSIRNLVNLQRL